MKLNSRCFRISAKYLLFTACCLLTALAKAQTTAQIVNEIRLGNSKVTDYPCHSGKGLLISNKAMSAFLSNKVSSYLSDHSDLSLYKNYVVLNATEGSITINHNFHQPVDSDDYVRSFIVIGARVNFANAYTSRILNTPATNQLGFTLQKTWMGKPVTYYNKCGSQKMAMDAYRAQLLHRLEIEITRKAADFEQSLDSVKSTEVPGQDLQIVKQKLKLNFYAALRQEYLQKFATAQATLLIQSNNYLLVTTNWTTIGAYVPIIRQQYLVSTTINENATHRYNYPLGISLTHTRFWDSPKYGRLFFITMANSYLNNTVQSGNLSNTEVYAPTIINGTNATVTQQENRYTGNYKKFITTAAAAKAAYIPPNSHVGISFKMEKNFGNYHALNGILGIPIVLIDKKGVPAINFEPQLLFADINNTLKNIQVYKSKTTIGLTVGIPFSKVVY